MQGAGGVGGLVAMTVHNGALAGTYFCGYDGNGNIAVLVNVGDGTEAARYEYGPFGELVRATGPLAKLNPFRFSTKYQDDETDLLYYGFRYYTATTGRWLSRDPVGEFGGLNINEFGNNDALNSPDFLGLAITTDCDIKKYLNDHGVTGFTEDSSDNQNTYSGTAQYNSSDIVSEILGTMINSGRNFEVADMSHLQLHVTARMEAVNYARNSKFSFATFVTGQAMPEKYWDFDYKTVKVNGVEHIGLKKGLSLSEQQEAFATLRDSPSYQIACKQAMEAAVSAGAVNAGVSGAGIADITGIANVDWVPGDWGYIQNTGVRDKNAGTSGENILYMGNGKYWGHWLSLGQDYPTLDALNAARILSLEKWESMVDDFDGKNDRSFKLADYRKYTKAGLK